MNVTTITNASQGGWAGRAARGTGGAVRAAGLAKDIGGRRGHDGGGGGDQAGQPDGAVEVGGAGRRPLAEGGPALGPALVDVGAAEADPQCPGERGLTAARVRAGM